MELNNIQLTPQMLADLYPNVLVESTATAVPEDSAFSFLGDNNKNIVVLVNETSAKYLPEKELNFLVSVLTACQLSLGDTAIINTSGKKIDYEKVTNSLKAKVVLLFNVPPGDINLPLEFPFFQVQKFREQTYVYSPALGEVEKDVQMKKQLWTALKKAFGI
jgi:hypothetical protein